jgi:hypothetical protein
MRRPVLLAALLLALVPVARASPRAGIGLRAGAWYGLQQVNDAKINGVYGKTEAYVFLPYLEARFGPGWTLGAGYEFGYDRNGLIGPYDYTTRLRMSGINILAGYEFRTKSVAVFAQAGLGLYSYTQTIDNPNVTDMPVDARKTTVLAAAGIKYYPADVIFLAFEARYVPLKVKPYDVAVDLGGWRFAVGAGFAVDFR